MVIVKLSGGLGNQLFQYAAGKRLATTLSTSLRLDISTLGDSAYRTPRSYELGIFGIADSIASDDDLSRFKPVRQGWLSSFLKRDNRVSKGYIREAHFHFAPEILFLTGDVYLDGYWQSERYFSDRESLIRKALRFRYEPDTENQSLVDEIQGRNAVSLHVRRGDYMLDEVVSKVHGVCGLDYYSCAVNYISEKIWKPFFYVFSDEPEWAKENIKFPYPMRFVDHNGLERGYEDLRLMSLCKHNIIANSTFSWWGAWLNRNRSKIVVAPRRWFNEFDADTKDICPDSWERY